MAASPDISLETIDSIGPEHSGVYEPNPHIEFGRGEHFCLGVPIAYRLAGC